MCYNIFVQPLLFLAVHKTAVLKIYERLIIYMTVRRKSNWYIYLIAFAIALVFAVMVIVTFRWFLFPNGTIPTGLTSAGELSDSFTPSEDYNLNMLVMLSEEENGIPDFYFLTAYNAVDGRISVIPLQNGISVQKDGRTLPNVYAAQGGAGAAKAVENAVGAAPDKYVTFDRANFIKLVSAYGGVDFDVPDTMIIKDGDETETLNAGLKSFSAELVYRYIMKAEFDDENARFNTVGNLIMELLNQNAKSVDGALLDDCFQYFIDSYDTDFTADDYNLRKAALLNTCLYISKPAEYYVPYGEYLEDGSFIVSDTSITTISQKTSRSYDDSLTD